MGPPFSRPYSSSYSLPPRCLCLLVCGLSPQRLFFRILASRLRARFDAYDEPDRRSNFLRVSPRLENARHLCRFSTFFNARHSRQTLLRPYYTQRKYPHLQSQWHRLFSHYNSHFSHRLLWFPLVFSLDPLRQPRSHVGRPQLF